MAATINRTDIVDSATIATMAGVSRSAVTQWKDRHADFPAPLAIPGVINPLYSRRAVLAWLAQTGRLAPENQEN